MHMLIKEPPNDPGRVGLPLRSTAVLEELNPIVTPVYNALERAIEESNSYFSEQEHVIDPFLFPNLVRYNALQHLEDAQKEVDGLHIEKLSNNGIFMRFMGYRIRVWKADEGELPAPGNGDGRLKFFEQPDLFPGMRFMNLAIIWDATSKGTLKNLMLVCPKGDGNPSNVTGQAHWQIEIPHPATQVAAAEVFETTVDDLQLEKSTTIKKASSQDD